MSTDPKDTAKPVEVSEPEPVESKPDAAAAAAAVASGATNAAPKADDDDLDDLDDLLDDFAEDVLNKPPGSAKTATESQSVGGDVETGAASADKPINDEFKTRIEDLIKDLNIEDPETKDQFEKLVKEFETDHEKEAEAINNPQQFDNVMKDAMDRLRKSGENIDEQLKNDPSGGNPEDMLTQLLAGLGGPGGAGGAGGEFDMSKLLVDMLEQLSSKEVLYEPIKDLNSKFPEYLTEKKGVIADDQHANYSKQYEITTDILAIFETPGYTDEDKQKRDRVNTLLESLQELGQPPSELVGDASDFPGFGGAGGLGGLGGLGGAGSGLDFSDKDLPKDFEKELEEGCKQT